jgi:hypothetical protein
MFIALVRPIGKALELKRGEGQVYPDQKIFQIKSS